MWKSVLTDLLTGFLALAVVMAGFVTGILGQDLRAQVMVAGALFLLAGLIRGAAAASNPWIQGLLVNLGSSVPVCIMALAGVAFTSGPHLMAFLATSLLATVVGAHVRRFWRLARPGASLAVAGAWAVAVLLAAQWFVPAMLERLSTERVNRAAPPFSFGAPNGGSVTNESLHGRVAVLAFWATWCTPCREELPRLNRLYEQYDKNRDVAFLAVDTERDDDLAAAAKKAKAFFAKTGLSLPLVIGDNDASNGLGVSGLPALLIIDQQGHIRLRHTGYDGAENLERIVSGQITVLLRDAGS
jgi:thiol-disulfide isomerase/thioredoxin